MEFNKLVSTKDIGLLIKTTRKAQGVTQEQLAGVANTGIRFISDLEKEFGSVTISANGIEYKFGYNEEITIQRNGEEMKIHANQFNKETDLLGIDD